MFESAPKAGALFSAHRGNDLLFLSARKKKEQKER